MRVLIDTHVLLWALAEPENLSPDAAALIRDADNTLLVSPASAWEIATKWRLGRLPGAEPIVARYVAHMQTLRALELPITAQHALKAGGFAVPHRDPFDRMLAAQAMIEGVALLTSDRAFRVFEGLATIW